jgi:hypothetical protein
MDPKFVRMVKCPTDYFLYTDTLRINRIEDIRAAADNDRASHIEGRVWLIYNEPDGIYGECGPEYIDRNNPVESNRVRHNGAWAADRYIFIYDEIKIHDPSARVFAGGLLYIGYPDLSNSWWNDFLTQLIDRRGALNKLDGAHLHAYPGISTPCTPNPSVGIWCVQESIQALNNWYSNYHSVGKRLEHRPIWITEVGTSGLRDWFRRNYSIWNEQVFSLGRDNVMNPLISWFTGTNPGYNSMEWFIPYCVDSPPNDCVRLSGGSTFYIIQMGHERHWVKDGTNFVREATGE